MPTYIIEHLEPKLWKWCVIEYKHISQMVGKQNLWFTNVNHLKSGGTKLQKYGKVIKNSIVQVPLSNVCVLDPDAEKILTPADAKRFDYFIFGGILGNEPPQKRTAPELTFRFKYPIETRNIGTKQMSTDNAVAVVQQIVQGKKFDQLPFQDGIEIDLKDGESIMFPYRYLLKDGKPLVSEELMEYLKKKKGI